LARLQADRHLPDDFRLIGIGRHGWDTARFRSHFLEGSHADDATDGGMRTLLDNSEYHRADVAAPDELTRVLAPIAEPYVVYLALPPHLFAPAITAIAAATPPAGSKVVVEKPFGDSLETARGLNRLIHARFSEDAVFRLDHFLGMQTVQNILALRFANRIFEPLWNAHHIERVEIVWDEMLSVEGRAGFYDSTGALRDMVQNHLLQLLALIAMEPVATLDERSLRNRKVDVLRAVRRLSLEDVAHRTVRARYTDGTIDGRVIPAYADDPKVDPARQTETLAEIVLAVDNWRWAGVPFFLRSGKALGQDRREIALHFSAVPHVAFCDRAPVPNVLRLDLDPDRIGLTVSVKAAGDLLELETIELDARLASADLPPYAWLVLSVLRGDPTLSIRDDEAEELWRIVEPVLQAWNDPEVAPPLQEYAAGSDGPPSLLPPS
jgi:glucose-6-phosphate 1-dehydrogenase